MVISEKYICNIVSPIIYLQHICNKLTNLRIMNKLKDIFLLSLLVVGSLLVGCKADSPEEENEEEIITDVTLTFTNGATTLVFTASDPDGEGPLELTVDGPINLVAGTQYDLSIEFYNSIEDEDITEEVEEEGDEHMIFFGFTSGLFSSPTGSGNINGRANPINYEDQDVNGLPIGLNTSWTTGSATTGTFRIVLKHQPGLKTASSSVNDGESDVDITWSININ